MFKNSRKSIALFIIITMVLGMFPSVAFADINPWYAPVNPNGSFTTTVVPAVATGDVITVTPAPTVVPPVVTPVQTIVPIIPTVNTNKPIITPVPVKQANDSFDMDNSEGLSMEAVNEYIDSISGQWFTSGGDYRYGLDAAGNERTGVQYKTVELDTGYADTFYYNDMAPFIGKTWSYAETQLANMGFSEVTLVKDTEKNLLLGFVPFGGDDPAFIEIKFNMKNTKIDVIQIVEPGSSRSTDEIKDIATKQSQNFTANNKFNMALLNNNNPDGYMVAGYGFAKAKKGGKCFSAQVVMLGSADYDMESDETSYENNMNRVTMSCYRWMLNSTFENKPAAQ